MKKIFLIMVLTGLFSACVNTDLDSETPPWDRTDMKNADSKDLAASLEGSSLPSWESPHIQSLADKSFEALKL